jgi:hypothetical protein
MVYWGIEVLPERGETVQSIIRSVNILVFLRGRKEEILWYVSKGHTEHKELTKFHLGMLVRDPLSNSRVRLIDLNL